jgi:hypothetical protein
MVMMMMMLQSRVVSFCVGIHPLEITIQTRYSKQ